MKLGDIIQFRKDLFFEGAVQADWFYDQEKASKVAENFVFHGKEYFGIETKKNSIDTIGLVKALSEKFNNDTANPRSLAIADYGTGKSHLAVTLGVLFSGPDYMPETHKKIIRNIATIDEIAAKEIKKLCNDRNFVIVLNGIRDFNLHSELLKAVQRSLLLYGLDNTELRSLNKTIETASIFFERNARNQITLFEKFAKERNWNEKGEDLLNKLRSTIGGDDDAFEIVNDVYEETTGQRIRWEEGISAKSILEMLLSKYCGLNGQFDNVVVLFDEFGRFLEYASGTDASKCGDSALQQLFEVSQNASGTLHLINFIQADIKTYLLRVDQNRNLSRYIGRFDESEKYHISSNLETVFANLINRADKENFAKHIEAWQNENEEQWNKIFEFMNEWLQTSGVWSDYAKFRKVIVEGIYPMHPVSTYMLTQLSDYMQNRSSMTIISQYIDSIAGENLEDAIPLIMPTDLMTGDLYIEMLAAEVSGRHRSQYCTQYDNILKKNGDKLNENAKSVLRANLISRALHFNTRNYDDAKEVLVLCSGLSEDIIDESLTILVDEYATMAFDEQSGCFDFTEDAKGAYDYKVLKNRLVANSNTDIRALFRNAKVQDVLGISQLQDTHFGVKHKIPTNEWCFKQEIVLAEDVSEELINRNIEEWKKAKSVTTPKGQLIWVYANKDTDYKAMDKLYPLVGKTNEMPIVFMLINDSENIIQRILVEYDVLDNMDDSTRVAYNALFIQDQDRVEENLKKAFDNLKRNREIVTVDGIERGTKRLPILLSDTFENIYHEAIPYNFDGLLTSANNFTGKGVAYYCQIMKMLLSNKINYDTIHDFQIDIRNRIAALFMTDNSYSWMCINKEYSIVPPMEEKVRNIYSEVESILTANEEYPCSMFYEIYCNPPFGLSEEAATMLLAVMIANSSHNLRLIFNNEQSTIVAWKDLVVDDKKLHIDIVKQSTLIWVDTDSIEAKFQQLFKKIDANNDLEQSTVLEEQLEELIKLYGLPEEQVVYKRVADSKFKTFKASVAAWDEMIEDMQNRLDKAEERISVTRALDVIDILNTTSTFSIFGCNNIHVSNEYDKQLEMIDDRAHTIVENNFNEWLSSSVYCKSPGEMNNFEQYCNRCTRRLKDSGYVEFARKVMQKRDKELANKQEIKSRNELVSDGNRYIKDYEGRFYTKYSDIVEMIARAGALGERFKKYTSSLGKEAAKAEKKIAEIEKELASKKAQIDNDASSVWDDVFNAETVEDILFVNDCIDGLLDVGLPASDIEDFKDLKKTVQALIDDINMASRLTDNRKLLEEAISNISTKYSNEEMEYDFSVIIEDCVNNLRIEINKKDAEWKEMNLTLGDKSRASIYKWKDTINVLPEYLSESTLTEINELDIEAEKLIAEGKIEDVIHYFDKLNDAEKISCLARLNEKCRFRQEEKQ